MSSHDIYIALIRTNTKSGRFFRIFSGRDAYPYTHAAVSFDNTFRDFYTFGRKHLNLPFDGGFVNYKRDFYAFGKNNSFNLKVFRLTVFDKAYQDICTFVDECSKDKKLKTNCFSTGLMPLFHGFRIWKTMNDIQFCTRIAYMSGLIEEENPRPYWRVSVRQLDDMMTESRLMLFESELLRENTYEYMEYSRPYNFFVKLGSFFKMFGSQIGRIFRGIITQSFD